MNRNLGPILLPAALLFCGLAFSQNPPAQAPDAKKLEKDLSATRQRVEALSAEVAEVKARLEAFQKYADSQAKGAAAMAQVLDASEKAGFTFGINPDSRQLLLRGWREQLSAMQKDVPSAKSSAAPAGAGAPR